MLDEIERALERKMFTLPSNANVPVVITLAYQKILGDIFEV